MPNSTLKPVRVQAESQHDVKDTYNYVTIKTDVSMPARHIRALQDPARCHPWQEAVKAAVARLAAQHKDVRMLHLGAGAGRDAMPNNNPTSSRLGFSRMFFQVLRLCPGVGVGRRSTRTSGCCTCALVEVRSLHQQLCDSSFFRCACLMCVLSLPRIFVWGGGGPLSPYQQTFMRMRECRWLFLLLACKMSQFCSPSHVHPRHSFGHDTLLAGQVVLGTAMRQPV